MNVNTDWIKALQQKKEHYLSLIEDIDNCIEWHLKYGDK